MSTEAPPLTRASRGAEGAPSEAEKTPARLLSYRIVPVPALTPEAIEEMLRLFRAHFQVPVPETFVRDLRRKQLVIQILDREERLRGFSTITSYRTSFRGSEVGVVYSGDTIISPDCWGTSILPRAWLQAVMEMAVILPRPLYWLLLSSGYKTYRMLPTFFRSFFPRCDQDTPEVVQGMIRHLASALFGEQFDAERGIIHFGEGATPLRPGVADVQERRLRDPHTAFFLERNPGHEGGDELVCVAEICDGNLSPCGRRILRALGMEKL